MILIFRLYYFQKLIFAEGGEIFSLWKTPPVDIYIKIYLWNITNSEAFLNGDEKMKLEEVGPYVYRFVHIFSRLTFRFSRGITLVKLRVEHVFSILISDLKNKQVYFPSILGIFDYSNCRRRNQTASKLSYPFFFLTVTLCTSPTDCNIDTFVCQLLFG